MFVERWHVVQNSVLADKDRQHRKGFWPVNRLDGHNRMYANYRICDSLDNDRWNPARRSIRAKVTAAAPTTMTQREIEGLK